MVVTDTLKSSIITKLSKLYYVRQYDGSGIQDDLRLTLDEDYMNNSEIISLFTSRPQLKRFQCYISI